MSRPVPHSQNELWNLVNLDLKIEKNLILTATKMKPEDVKKQPTIFTICSQMSGFCYDSAKELSDREKDAVKSSKPPLAGLMAAFSQLCVIEKQYYSLTFLTPKRFLMKDTALNTSYSSVLNSLKKVEEWRSSATTRELATQVLE